MRCEINFRVALGTLLIVAGLSVSWVLAADPPPEGEEAASVAVRLYLTEGSLPTDDPNAASWNAIRPSEFKLAPQVHWPDRIQ